MRKLLITADTGWSNGWRLRLRKSEFQKFADRTGLSGRWNKIEHRLFSFIAGREMTNRNIYWHGEPLRDYETIVHLIARMTRRQVI